MQPEVQEDRAPSSIVLAAVERELADAWELHCGDLPGVRVHRGSILEVDCDAVVSPANSFGFMVGGIDQVYSQAFGDHVQERLQECIREEHGGELLVGRALIVETDHARIPYVISAPTMRVPLRLGPETVNPYLAARAALRLVQYGTLQKGGAPERVARLVGCLALPGLGTGVGGVPPELCARQVRQALEDSQLAPAPFPRSWREARERHERLQRD